MAEADGMLLNFDIGEGPIHARPTFKGGPWKARVRAKKSAQYKERRTQQRRNEGAKEELILPKRQEPAQLENRSAKRRRTVLDDKLQRPAENASSPTTANGEPERTVDQGADPPKAVAISRTNLQKSGPVVSSLFTSNPKSTVPKEDVAEPSAPAEPSNAPLPDGLSSFTKLGISQSLGLHLLNKMELKNPTAIQQIAVPRLIQEDTDAFIQAQTGSGKTLAYLLPIIERLTSMTARSGEKMHRDSGLFAIILAPTRELCRQISVVLDNLLRCAHWIVSGTLMGGENKRHEKAKLRKGLNILIATPGRLVDHLDNTEALNTGKTCWLVLDEGDRLMELGFEDDIRKIVAKVQRSGSSPTTVKLPTSRKITVLCSATMRMDVQRLGEISLKEAIHLQSSAKDDEIPESDASKITIPAQLTQSYAIIPSKQRLVTLTAVLKRAFAGKSTTKAIIFLSCADSVDFHFSALTSDPASSSKETTSLPSSPSISATLTIFKLHGTLPAPLRTSTLSRFRALSSDTSAVLLSTDVSSRGLDLPSLDLVIELDPPFSAVDHTHRIGRTARAGAPGRALIFLSPGAEEGYTSTLRGCLGAGRNLVRHDAEHLLRKGFGSPGLGAGKDWEERASEWQLDVERRVEKSTALGEMARRAFRSHVRAYATHVAEERGFFDVKKLHLGHVAKGFGLRETPGDIGRKRAVKIPDGAEGEAEAGESEGDDEKERRRKMRRAMRAHMDAKGEFNIG